MNYKESIPYAHNLIEAMRSLGYSFETAIADLIDNSISAKAKSIEIYLLPDDFPELIIFDDGIGMDENKLMEALRYGSKSPLDERNEYDLGRFGLGLKSASLSQCRQLIVASKQNGKVNCFSWDLDVVEKEGWKLIQYDEIEICELPMIDLFEKVETGTYILLRNFDKISQTTANLKKTLTEYMSNTIEHLALVFHRFLNDNVDIYVNNSKIIPLDPFLKDNHSTQKLREQSFNIKNAEITVQPYILPIITKLTLEDMKKVGGKNDLKNNQGFYIYRNKRLIIWGTWFKLARKEELGKLARVQVDIPNSLDYMWGIDVKKSTASLPDIIKSNLKNCIIDSVFKSRTVHEYRGRKIKEDDDINYIWERMELRDGCFEYKINRELPQLTLLKGKMNEEQNKILDLLIGNIEDSFPTYSIYLDNSQGKVANSKNKEIEDLYEELKIQLCECEQQGLDKERMLEILLKTEPYCKYEELNEMFERRDEACLI